MSSGDRFKDAVDLTTGLDLPQDTALPAQRRRRASLILKDVVGPFEGGIERAALATVFGVREYTESKVLWESQKSTGAGQNNNSNNSKISKNRHPDESPLFNQPESISGSVLIQPLASNIAQQHGWQPSTTPQQSQRVSHHSQQVDMPYLDPMTKGGQLQTTIPESNCNRHPSNGRPAGAVVTLPDIPAVSKFDDWLTTSSQVTSSKARVISPSSVKPPLSNSIHHSQQQQQHYQLDIDVTPPLVFLSYPSAIFDLLRSDTDDRIIIWGPDPQAISVSGATTPNYSRTSLQPVHSKLGFSSNTTMASTTPPLSIHSGTSIRSSMKSTIDWISKVKQSIHYPTFSPSTTSPSTIDNNENLAPMATGRQHQKHTLQSLLSRRLSSKNHQYQQPPSSVAESPSSTRPPLVIQAATVEKLVEKLTLTLDYTFMTDFFLTYRIFISPVQLCKLLILRFQWGLENDEDDRRVVRIRTFVVIRHWLLNYFVHDFVSSRELRKVLVLFLNTLPLHSLVKNSPLDQRIVKGLKQVVRRLKKVHYPRSSQRVQVISPPPPIFDKQQVREMLHAKLSQNPLRRKTEELIHKDMAFVENRHYDNMAFQDARMADIVVVGSSDKSPLPPSSTTTAPTPSPANKFGGDNNSLRTYSQVPDHSQQQSPPNSFGYDNERLRNTSQTSVAKYAALVFSKKKARQQELHKVKQSYIQRMEQQKRTMEDQQLQILSKGLDHNFSHLNLQQNHRPSVTSDVSLESIVSPGTTDDELEEDSDYDDDSALANDVLETLNDDTTQQNGSYHVYGDDDARHNGFYQAAPATSTMGNRLHRRSVYNAVLSDLSPLVSPNGSMIHGPLVHSLGGGPASKPNGYPSMKDSQGRQLATPSSSIDKILRLPMELNMNSLDRDKTESTIVDELRYSDETPLSAPSAPPLLPSSNQNMTRMKNRISKSLLEIGEVKSPTAIDDDIDGNDEKVLVECPTSMSFKSTGSPQNELESITTRKRQHKLSRRLINAFRSAGNTPLTKATVVQPKMTIPSTASSSIYQPGFASHHQHLKQQHCNKPASLPSPPENYQRQHGPRHISNICTTWEPSQLSIVTPSQSHRHSHQHHRNQHPDVSYLKNIRASLDDDYHYSPNTSSEAAEERNHQQQQQRSRVPELDTSPRRSTDNIPPSLSALFKPSMILQHRSHALAQQFCLVEKWILLQVDWEELVHCRWTKERGTYSSVKTPDIDGDAATTFYSTKRSPKQDQQVDGDEQEDGIQQLINRFNMVCQWVSSEIVRTPSLEERALVIEKFIRLAQKCHMYSNFATLVQILLGLQSSSVSRLRKTWSKVADSEIRLLEQLSAFTSPMKNWKHIRDNMTAVAEEYGMSPKEIQIQLPGSSDRHELNRTKIKLPFGGCIPFLGLYLSDLVFNSEQRSYLEPNHDHHKIYQSYTQSSCNLSPPPLRQPLVNFRKHRMTATIIKRFLTFKDLACRYSFEQADPLYSDCFYLNALETDTLGRLSLTIEPPPPSFPT
ncbi:hypothetical protein BCR42DRAFT_7105 [Absidia repens]|uniref:Ras guanine nucleotide exchange factor domain-containing protein n=1 Tax=Absidia repens TaxID=90262 RepID=A0A1X2J2E0_9FUNG|nr:hypothetical protein BCR42DRAFT_7105 [Absidia repens]